MSDELLRKFDTFLFDCDGVLWRGSQPIPGSIEAVRYLREQGKRTGFITNNATKSRRQCAERLHKLGLTDVAIQDIFCSAYIVAMYLKHHLDLPSGTKIFVIGESGFEEELRREGYIVVGGTDSYYLETANEENLKEVRRDPDIKAVVVGLDRQMSYLKLCWGHAQLADPECAFILSNIDTTFPTEVGDLPGAGSMAQVLCSSSGRTPISVGKPEPICAQIIRETLTDFDPRNTLMVGDRLNTDIKFGNQCGMKTLLVYSGVTKDADKADGLEKPTYTANDLGTLFLQNRR